MAARDADIGRLYALAFVLFAVFSLAFAWPWLAGWVTIPWDAKAHFYAQLVFLAHALHHGESPFWTPNVFAGSVQIADPQSLIFTPPYLLLAALDPEPSFRAADATIFAMLFAGGIGLMLFFRDRGWHPAGALVAALAFAFGGSAAWRIQHIGEVLSLCWFAITLWLVARPLDHAAFRWARLNADNVIDSNNGEDAFREKPVSTFSQHAPDLDDFGSNRTEVMNVIDSENLERDAGEKPAPPFSHPALDRRSLAFGALAGLAGGCMVVGRDQIAFLCALVLVAYVAWRLLAEPGRFARITASLPALAAGLVCGLIVSAVPLALTIALAAQSNRPDIAFADAVQGSLHPAAFLTALAADLYGTRGPMANYWGTPSSPLWGPIDFVLARNMGDIYFGALPLLALVLGLARGRLFTRSAAIFAVAALVMAFYAFGKFTPFFRSIFGFPGVDLFRRPADATFPLGALLALLGGYCVHAEIAEPRAWSWRAVAIATAIIACLFVAALSVAIDLDRLPQALAPLLTALFCLVASGAAVAFGTRWTTANPTLVVIATGTVLFVDLVVNNGPNESTALPPQTYDVLRPDTANATIALIKQKLADYAAPDRRDRVELAAVGYEWPNAGLVHGFDDDLGFNPVRLELYAAATGAGDQVAVPEERIFSPLFPSYRSTMADLLGLRLIVTGVPVEQMDHRLAAGDIDLVARTPDAYVYENPRALPRVLFATQARQADFAAMLKTGDWPAVDYRQTVLLQNAPENSGPSRAPGSVRIVAYHNTDITLDAQSPDGGYVVLNDVWQRWWRADVDGRAAAMLRANVIFRAVAVPAGRHVVHFSFHPLGGLITDITHGAGGNS